MTKRQMKSKRKFSLTQKAGRMLDRYFTAIRKGIENVSEMHTYDSNPSMTQAQFEAAYIDKLLATPIAAISATIRSMAEALSSQKEAETKKLLQKNNLSKVRL